MPSPAPGLPDGHAARPGRAALPPNAVPVLAGVFSAAALGSLVLIGVDLAIGRAAGGDLFIAGLNGAAATVFWRWRSRGR